MPFTVRDFQSLIRALEKRTEWKAELRRLLLTEELLSLPQVVRELAAALARLSEDVHRLTEDVRRLSEAMRELVAVQRLTDDRLGRLEGSDLERRYGERAAGFFQRILSRIRLIAHQELGLMLDDAVETGAITPEEKGEILLADVVVRGRRDQRDTYLVAEVSVVVDVEDVRRAASRARLLRRATGEPVLAAVAGRRVTAEAGQDARAAGAWLVLDGRVEEPATSGH